MVCCSCSVGPVAAWCNLNSSLFTFHSSLDSGAKLQKIFESNEQNHQLDKVHGV